jgi:hypothetical protein
LLISQKVKCLLGWRGFPVSGDFSREMTEFRGFWNFCGKVNFWGKSVLWAVLIVFEGNLLKDFELVKRKFRNVKRLWIWLVWGLNFLKTIKLGVKRNVNEKVKLNVE